MFHPTENYMNDLNTVKLKLHTLFIILKFYYIESSCFKLSWNIIQMLSTSVKAVGLDKYLYFPSMNILSF